MHGASTKEQEARVLSVFNPLSFLRHVPTPILEQFFSSYPTFTGFDWSEVTERNVEAVLDRCNSMPAAERARVFTVFRNVESLSNSLGTRILLQAARDLDLEITAAIRESKNSYERALWCHLEHPRLFECARTLLHIDGLPKRSWETFKNLPQRSIEVTPEMIDAISQHLSHYFWSTQCRGDRCKVEHRHCDDQDLFFAYPADYPDENFGYGKDGEFERRNWNPAFEVVFRYHRADGTTDIFGQGGKKVREVLSQVFAHVVLGVEQEPKPWLEDSFDLELFKNPDLTFPTDTVDNVISVRVQAMRLEFHGHAGGQLTIRIDGRRKEGNLYEVIADKLNERHARLGAATILGVTLQVRLRTEEGREKSVMFKISAPSFCDLEDTPEEQMLRRYLKTWKIEKDANHLATAA